MLPITPCAIGLRFVENQCGVSQPYWSDSSVVNFENWEPGEPNNNICKVMERGTIIDVMPTVHSSVKLIILSTALNAEHENLVTHANRNRRHHWFGPGEQGKPTSMSKLHPKKARCTITKGVLEQKLN
ncbi:hypothetical protein NECAME_14627 [Necator americanus]|uniref:C-type lectin domain-containing protein n=1 Tax=Necator americanus TaxID=51031 RepID=W2SP37_NECAM|nr:hypothetical protein NECAME_14627 [Necator americanus]ETN70641.1 hypothetical protein NECAME_14627 [Necator americanus]